MAFATSNVKHVNLGSIQAIVGDWSGSVGDASGSIATGGSRIYLADVWSQDADSPKEWTQISVSEAANSSTVTVYNHDDVTTGRFVIIFA